MQDRVREADAQHSLRSGNERIPIDRIYRSFFFACNNRLPRTSYLPSPQAWPTVIARYVEGLHPTHPSRAIRAYTAAEDIFSTRTQSTQYAVVLDLMRGNGEGRVRKNNRNLTKSVGMAKYRVSSGLAGDRPLG